MAEEKDEKVNDSGRPILRDEKGRLLPGTSGRPKGAVDRITRTVKETVLMVFNKIQEDPETALESFARKYPRDFYAIAAKLIPTDIRADVRVTKVTLEIVRDKTTSDQLTTPASTESN